MAKDELKTIKFQMMLSESEARAIDDWGFSHRIRSRAEAIRRLCQMALFYDDRAEGMQEYADLIAAGDSTQKDNEFAEVAIQMAGDVRMLGQVRRLFSDGGQTVAMDRIEEARQELRESRERRTKAINALRSDLAASPDAMQATTPKSKRDESSRVANDDAGLSRIAEEIRDLRASKENPAAAPAEPAGGDKHQSGTKDARGKR